jgi:hypothetical protein
MKLIQADLVASALKSPKGGVFSTKSEFRDRPASGGGVTANFIRGVSRLCMNSCRTIHSMRLGRMREIP